MPPAERARATALAAAIVAVCSGCGALAGGTGSVPGGFDEDHVLIGDYGEVAAVAASPRMVFAAAPGGLAIRDVLADRWLPPLTDADGYPGTRITGLAADPELDAVWILALGEVLYYRPAIDQLIRTAIAGRVDRIFFDRLDPGGGAYIGYADQWVQLSTGGFAAPIEYDRLPPAGQRIFPPTIETLMEEMPSLQSFGGLLTRDDALRSWRLTSGARIPQRSDVWLGTMGGGLYLADPVFNRARPVAYGLFERGAASLALAADGVWIGALGLSLRGTGGIAATTSDLQQWSWLRGPADGSMAGLRVHDIAIRDGTVWVATDRGVAQRGIVAGADGRGSEWRWLIGRQTGRAFALAASSRGIWVGTDQGVMGLGPAAGGPDAGTVSGEPVGMIPSPPVRALALVGDTLWVGTDAGLRRLRIGDPAPRLFDFANVAPSWINRAIVAFARSDSILAVATDERVALIDVRRGTLALLPGEPDLARLGRLFALAIDGRTVWVGGDRGAMSIARTSGLVRSVSRPGTLADPVLDIVLEPEFAWLATPAGVVRVRRLPDGGPR